MSNENETAISNNGSKMEGWLYLIRCNRFGLQFSRKRYFVLDDHLLRSFKSVPNSTDQVYHFFQFHFTFFFFNFSDFFGRKQY